MKKSFFIFILVLFSCSAFSQWSNSGDNFTSGNLSVQGNINFIAYKLLTAAPADKFTYDNQTMGHYALRWGSDSWNNLGGYTFWLSSYNGMKFFTSGASRFSITRSGNIGIGTDAPQSLLDVRGKIIADEVEIKVNKGSDFVFHPEYNLRSLSEIETFVKENKHLPEIPSEKEMQENGLNLNDMQMKLLQKIEELTLYVIEQNKQIAAQNERIKQLEK